MKHDHPIWSRESIQRTEIALAHAQKTPLVRFIDSALLHVLLFTAIIGNFILSVVFVPILIALEGIFLYICILIIAASFGALFSSILHGIEKAQPHHHLVAGLFIPALALINIAIIVKLTNTLITLMHLPEPGHNALLVGLVYAFGYILPELMSHLISR